MIERKTAAVRREEIVRVALALIAGEGPRALTTSAIARAVGVSQAAVFRHFVNKNAILEACVEWIDGQIRPAVIAAAAGPGNAEQRLRDIVAALLAVARCIPAMPTAMFSRELHTEFPGLRELLHQRRNRIAAVLQELLHEGVRGGEFSGALDVAAAAYLVMGMIHSLLFRWHHIEPDLDLEHEATAMIDVVLFGLKRR